jgi:RNA polymerase sigma factor (sigma-70 family)
MEIQYSELQSQIENILINLGSQKGEEITRQVKPILINNLEKRRVETYIGKKNGLLEDYIQKVIEKYELWHNYLHNIQVERDYFLWSQLLQKLTGIAFSYLRRKNFFNSFTTHQIAEDCASKAAEAILNAQFPYDIDFEPWIVQIVHNKCLKFMSEEMQKHKIPTGLITKFNEEIDCGNASLDILNQMIEEESDSEIQTALKQISPARREAILMRYIEDLSPSQIAEKLGKSVDAVYCLQFNGLRDLRKILVENRNKYNE